MMFDKRTYTNFVRSTVTSLNEVGLQTALSGDEVRNMYLAELEHAKDPISSAETTPTVDNCTTNQKNKRKHKLTEISLTDKQICLTVQKNDVDTLKQVLDTAPDKVNLIDDFGWSLLMIACQANAVETVKELLRYGVDTTVRDKAGNSAQTLVIRNNNIVLVDLLLHYKHNQESAEADNTVKHKRKKIREEFLCEICNSNFPDKQNHLFSTIHNINASKGRRIPTNYIIPESNKGYQIMLKVGWDKESGLGPDGSGTKYPIKTKQKKDRKGLGHDEMKKTNALKKEKEGLKNITILNKEYHNRRMEINFRREFY